MKKNLARLAAILITASAFGSTTLNAQEVIVEGYSTKGRNSGEQIVITRKDSSDKMIIVVDGENILVNGKPVSDTNRDVTVTRRKVRDVSALAFTPGTRFRASSVSSPNTAVLGVTTASADKGVKVLTVSKKSGAEKAGLKKDDIITKIDDRDIDSPDELSKAIRGHKTGDKVTVSYSRAGKSEKVTAELGKLEEVTVTGYGTMDPMDFNFDNNLNFNMDDVRIQSIPRGVYGQTFNSFSGAPRLGLTVQDTDEGKGVKVLDVNEDGNAAKAGIEEDDVILEVDGKAVNSADEIAKVMKDSKDKVSVSFKYQRDGKTKSVDVRVPRRLKTANL